MRLIKIYIIFIKQYFKILLEYKFDFFIGLFSFLFAQGASIIFLVLIFDKIPNLSGWSFEQIIFIYGFAQIPRGIDHLLTDQLWSVGTNMIKDGAFDRYLLRPINPLFQLFSEKLQTDAFGEIILGVLLFTYGYKKMDLNFTMIEWGILVITLLSAALIYTSIKLITTSIAFWTKKSHSLMNFVYSFSEFANYPISIYSKVIRGLLTFVIPFAFISFIPASVFIGRPYYKFGEIITIIVSIITFSISYIIWNKGLNIYESVGN